MENTDYDMNLNSYEYTYSYEDSTYSTPPLTTEGSKLKYLQIVVYCIIVIFGTFLNGFIIFRVCFLHNTAISIFFSNLATIHLLSSLFLSLNVISSWQNHHWSFGLILCKANSFLHFLNMFFTASIITVVAGYRFVKLMAPCFAQRCHSVGTISCSLVVIWMGSTMLSTPSLVIRDTTIHEDNEIVCKDNYALIALVPKVHETILLSRFFCGLAIPFLVTACCSGIILCRSGSSKMKSLQGYIIIRWVIIAYFLCWVPYQVVFILTYKTRKENKTLTTTWMPIVTVLSMANNVLTPAICIFMGDKKQKWMETAFNEKEEVGSQKVSEDQEL